MQTVLSLAFPVFAIIGVGFAAGRFKWLTGADSQALNAFVFRFAMPAALFGLTAGAAPLNRADLILAAIYAGAGFTTIFVSYFLAQSLFSISKAQAGAHAFSSTLGNAVFLGLPIALSVTGWARPYVVLMLVEGVFIIAIGAALMSPRKGAENFIARFAGYLSGPVRNPLVLSMAAGFVYASLGFTFDGPVRTFFSMFGQAAGPAALFSLGLFLATHPFSNAGAIAGRIGAIALFKLAALPALALSGAYFAGLQDSAYLGALALFVFVPSGVGSFIMATQYKVYETETAAAVSITTVISVATISVVLFLFA